MQNWKCFSKKRIDFDSQNIINLPNGKGKSSVFQAILFCLYGKRPTGFTFKSLRLDPTKDCNLELMLQHDNSENETVEVVVRRSFSNNDSNVLVLQNGEVKCSSIKASFDFINNILPQDIISVLWSPGTVQSSNILNPDFLVKSLFEHIFRDPKKIESHYKYEIYGINKVINSIRISSDSKEIQEKIDKISEEIKDTRLRIKDRSSSTDSELTKARSAEQAFNDLNKMTIAKTISLSVCQDYLSLTRGNDTKELKSTIKKNLKIEKDKKSSAIDNIPANIINMIIKESEKGNCLICEREWQTEYSDNIKKIIKKGKVDIRKIDLYTKQLELLKNDEKDIQDNINHNKYSSIIKSCPNFKDIINNYDEENNKLWNKLDKLENESKTLHKELEDYSIYINQKKKLNEAKKKLSVPQDYISKASSYYSHTMTENASEILCQLNSDYDQIFLDEEENVYKVTKIDEKENTINLLSAAQLSSGERTLVGISLILSAHSLFFPNVPLLFDESFSALDKENVGSLKAYFKKKNFQTFIITHDKYWSSED